MSGYRKVIIWFIIVTAALAVVAYRQGGWELMRLGVSSSLSNVVRLFPLTVLGFLLAGLVEALVSRGTVQRLLGQGAGVKGILLGCAAGAMTPGGPFIFYPLAQSFFRSGAGIGTIFAFLAAKELWSLGRLPLEIGVLGPRLALVRYMVTFPVPVIMGVLAAWFLSRYEPDLRQEMGSK